MEKNCVVQHSKFSPAWSGSGHTQPRKPKARATGVHPITDTKAIKLRDRSGPIATGSLCHTK